MTRRWLFGVMVLCGCGRFDFDERALEDAPPLAKKAPTLSYPGRINAVVGVTKVQVAPTFEGEGVTFRVSPSLPPGLFLDEVNGKISGIPSTLEDLVQRTITVSNEAGSAEATILFSSLKGNQVDRFDIDETDFDEGYNAACSVAMDDAAGCTFRAAYLTAIHYMDEQEPPEQALQPRMVILPAGTYTLTNEAPGKGTFIGPKRNVVISGAGPGLTIIKSVGNFELMKLDAGPSLRLENLTVSGFKGADGAAVLATRGKLEVFNVAFENNEAMANAGGVICADSGVDREVTIDIDSATFTNNKAVTGSGFGGVINASGAGTTVTVKRSTASGNQGTWGSFSHIEGGARLHLENSTLFDNTATTAGALASPGGTYTIVNSTIVNNLCLGTQSGGLFAYSNVTYTLRNTVVAGNLDKNRVQKNCSQNSPGAGTFTTEGGNVFGDGASDCGGSEAFKAASDLLNATDLKLAQELSANGGPTKTLAIQPGSVAQDRGQHCPAVDQRGVPRVASKCDAGAYELPPSTPDSQ